MHFEPNQEQQRGVFYYLLKKYQSKNSTFISVYNDPREGFCSTYTAIDDEGFTNRFLSVNNGSLDVFIKLNHYKLKITHIAIKFLKSYCYSVDWTIKDSTRGRSNLIAQTKITQCNNEVTCPSDTIVILKTSSEPIIDSLTFYTTTRSDGAHTLEFKSLEIYGDLYHIPYLYSCQKSGWFPKYFLFSFIAFAS